ncbi:hypothetical protein RhiirA1_479401 [Rhizophagus irregularis]|uniref:Uncharacterized protein n=1 Tax=Rhizophagus irregularis TaxID=588596 RepID=A0A2N0QQQ8_9GLOM|nr:hypothetical protein RhiirA1_479401 [Rhizophagus irregularis]
MEYNNSEMSDCFSNSEGSSFTEKEATLKKITELKKKIMKLENTSMKKEKTKKKSNQGLPIFKKKNINYQKIPSFLHIPKESMRLLVAEKLYPLCPSTEYRDMPINEINKCIDKFHKKNPSFPETVGSIINNTSNVCETQETNRSARTRKANVNRVNINRVKRKRVVCNEIKSNEIDVVIEEGYDDKESQHSEIEKNSKRKSKTRKILNDASSAAKYHKLQSDNDYEDVETSGQECEAIETDNNVSLAEQCPTSKPQSNNDDEAVIEVSDQESEAKEAKDTSSTSKHPGHKFKANKPNEEVIEIPDQESEVKKAIKNTTSTTKSSGRKFKANQPNEEVIEVPNQESEAKKAIKNTTSTTKRPGRKPKVKQPNNHDDEGVFGQESETTQ